MKKSQFLARNWDDLLISTGDVVENGEITHQVHLVSHGDEKGLLVCKRAYSIEESETYSIGRDKNGYRIDFYDKGEYMPVNL